MSFVSKLFQLFIILFLISFQVNSKEIKNCNWENENQTPCVLIEKNISNTSKFSDKGIRKIVITKKDIEESGAIDLIDVLKNIPDINITQSGPKGQQASLFMRGTGSNHTLVMINGVAINDQSATQGLHDFGVDFIQTIQQIEVYPGSNVAHFGANSVGGAINIILTGDYKDSISLSGDIENNYDILANKTFLLNDASLNLKLGTVNDKTISVQGDKNDDKDGVENYTANINYINYIKPDLKLHTTTYLRQTISEYDNSISNQTGYEGDNKMGSIHLGLENNGKKNNQNYLIYYTQYDREYDEKGTIDKYKSEVFGLKYDSSITLNSKLSYGFGADYKYDWGYFNNNGSYSSSTRGNIDNLAIYTNFGYNIYDNTNLSFFLRNDDHKQTGSDSTYKLNLDQEINRFNFGFSRMTGLRSPTLYELYGSDSFGYSGNKNLKSEKSITNEIYGNYNIDNKFIFSSTLFKSSILDNIEYLSASKQYVNDNDNVDLNQSGVNGSFAIKEEDYNLKFFTSFLSSKQESNTDQTRRPEKTYGFNLSKSLTNIYLGNFKLNVSYEHYGKHFDVQNVSPWSTIEVDSTDLVNMKIDKKYGNLNIYMKMTNLLDENYQRPLGYNQDGRRFNIGFKQSY